MTTRTSASPGQPGPEDGDVRFNGDLLRARRLELGLSERRLAALLGALFSVTILRSLEAGTNDDELTLAALRRLPLRSTSPPATCWSPRAERRHPCSSGLSARPRRTTTFPTPRRWPVRC